MEFTYHGLVRWSFGFHNPNHAAAAIVMLLALLWCARRLAPRPWIGWLVLLLELPLYAGLILTYSRAGMLVLLAVAGTWWLVSRRKDDARRFPYRWHACVALIAFICALSIHTGAGSRYTDTGRKAVASGAGRLDIWADGLRIFADNPQGTGGGVSGQFVTLFYTDGHPRVRTLVNSFLTVLVERGWSVGVLLIALPAFALSGLLRINRASKGNGNLRHQAISAMLIAMLIAAVLSGMLSTCFDVSLTLSNHTVYGILNDWLQRVLLFLFLAVLAGAAGWSALAGRSWRSVFIRGAACLATGLLVVLGCYGLGLYLNASALHHISVSQAGDGSIWATRTAPWSERAEPELVFPGRGGELHEIRFFLENDYGCDRYSLPVTPVANMDVILASVNPGRIVLCREAALYAKRIQGSRIVLYKPTLLSDSSALANVDHVYLYRWDRKGENGIWNAIADQNDVPIDYVEY